MGSVASADDRHVSGPKWRRLIDEELALADTSGAGRSERYARGTTSHTVHVWWARRPHSVMRAIVYACLTRGADPDRLALMQGLAEGPDADAGMLARARRQVREGFAGGPRVLDMFAGGGTIPYEALNLGADVWALDSNPLSVFIQRSLLVYPGGLGAGGLVDLVGSAGARVLTRLNDQTRELFPLRDARAREQPWVYLWTYSRACHECGYSHLLTRRPWLSRKGGKRIALRLVSGPGGQRLHIEQDADEERRRTLWRGRVDPLECPRCHGAQSKPDALACKDWLAATVMGRPRGGKTFIEGAGEALPPEELLVEREQQLLDALGMTLPRTRLPEWTGVVNPPLHGIGCHRDLFNPRQRVVALTLINLLREEHARVAETHGEAAARAVTSLLSALLDQLVDWNCRLSMWISQNEQIGRAFCGPGIAMLWDYAEMDPCLRGPANLWGKLERILSACRRLERLPGSARVDWGDARSLAYPDGFFDAVITDPPYYDNVPYAALADCFYAWKRLLLVAVEPELFDQESTASAAELVAASRGAAAAGDPHEHYCRELGVALTEAARVLAPDGVLSLLYSHAALAGWEALVRAFRASPFSVTAVHPLAIERRQRPRAMSARAVNACLVFVARKASTIEARRWPRAHACLRDLPADRTFETLIATGWAEADAALALFGVGVGVLADQADADVREGLLELERVVKERWPGFQLSRRRPL
jgi:putative DNA methylase